MQVLVISANTERLNMPTMPLGAGLVVAAARAAGHQVELLDLMLEADPLAAVRQTISRLDPRVIGVSIRNIDDQDMASPTFLLEKARPVVDICKWSGATVVLGGAGYSIFPAAALEYLGAELVRAMGQAGCVEVALGFESGSQPVLDAMNKHYTPPEVKRVSAMLAAAGIRRVGFLLLGGPGETRETVEQSLAFADSLELDALRTTVGIRIYPDTPLALRALEECPATIRNPH